MISYIKTPNHLSIVFDDGTPLTVYTNHPRFKEIISALNQKDWDQVRRLADPVVEVRQNLSLIGVDEERIKIVYGIVYFDDEPMQGLVFDRMVAMAADGFDISSLKRFIINLQDNPSYRAVQSLYNFLEVGDLPITEDGHFIAYKRVRTNFTDEKTGLLDNSPGKVVEMPRNKVNEDPEQTCSYGLHVCSRAYLPNYGSSSGGQVIMVKVHPRDVVAIPNDYNNSKMRVCRYEVLKALTLESNTYSALPKEKLEGPYVNTGTESKFLNDLEAEQMMVKAEESGRPMIVEVSENGLILGTYLTLSEAEKETGVCASSIGKVCRGQRSKAGGRFWKYIEVDELRNNIILRQMDNATKMQLVVEEQRDTCPDCGELTYECVCDDDTCPDCGESRDYCLCDELWD